MKIREQCVSFFFCLLLNISGILGFSQLLESCYPCRTHVAFKAGINMFSTWPQGPHVCKMLSVPQGPCTALPALHLNAAVNSKSYVLTPESDSRFHSGVQSHHLLQQRGVGVSECSHCKEDELRLLKEPVQQRDPLSCNSKGGCCTFCGK